MQPMSETEFRPQREALVPPGGIELFAPDMTATIAADVSLDEAQRQLATVDQWLPIDGDPRSPVGQLVEINSTGPLRLGYGGWRDLLLGCQFINGRGELITAGGRAVKNVAGYDLTKFMVGQQGNFGKILTITTRTYRRPRIFLSATFEPDVRRLNELLPTNCRPQWAILDARALTCGYAGDEAMIEFIEATLPRFKPLQIGTRQSEAVELRAFSITYEWGIAFRAAVPPMRSVEFAAKAGIPQWMADPVFGLVRGNGSEESLPALRAAAVEVGGSLWRERGEGIEEASDYPGQRSILQRLSQAFGS